MAKRKDQSKVLMTNKQGETQNGNDSRKYPTGANKTGGQQSK